MIWVFIIVIGAVIVIAAIVGGMGYLGGSPPAEKHHRSMTDKFIDWTM